MLPEGWKEKIFGDIVRHTQLGTTKRGADINLDHNLNLVKMGNLLWGGLDLSNVEKLSSTQLDGDYLLKKGDFLFNTRNTPELVGKSAVWKENLGSYCYDNNINRITFSNDADPFYMEYYLNFGSGKKSVRALASGSTSVAAIYWKGLKNLRIILPPLPEQKKIAAILSTWDRAIEGTEKLLANSQQQKKALMQQLLTGKKRLPGFTGEWIHLPFKKVAELIYGKALPEKPSAHTTVYPVYGTGGIISYSDEYLFEEPSIIIGRKGTIDTPRYVNTPFWCIDTTFYCKSIHNNDVKFLYYSTCFVKLRRYVEASGVPSLSRDTIYSIPLMLPPSLSEQKAIAAVLTSADEEITALESDLTRLRQEKKALMQQLLTGKRRVTVD